MLNRLYVL